MTENKDFIMCPHCNKGIELLHDEQDKGCINTVLKATLEEVNA